MGSMMEMLLVVDLVVRMERGMVIEMVVDLAMMMDEMMDYEMVMTMVATSEWHLDETRATRKGSMMDSETVDSMVAMWAMW